MYGGAFYAEGKGAIAAIEGSGEMAAELGRGIVETVDSTRTISIWLVLLLLLLPFRDIICQGLIPKWVDNSLPKLLYSQHNKIFTRFVLMWEETSRYQCFLLSLQ